MKRRIPSILFALFTLYGAASAGAAPPSAFELDEPELGPAFEPAPPPRARKAEMLARGKSRRAAAQTAVKKPKETKVVDCGKGDSLQAAIDKSAGDVTLEVRGLCNENVRVERRRLTLRGLDPAADGIRGVAADPPAFAALEIWYSELVTVENLSIQHPSAAGLGAWYSSAIVRNCRMSGNAQMGVHVSASSFLDGTELLLSNNGRQGLNVQRNSFAFCLGCRLENNATWAATATRGSILSLLDGTVTGSRGVQAVTHSYADIDCVSEDSPYPCSLNVTRTAGFALDHSTAAMFGAGPFAGQLLGFDNGEIYVYGAQQTSTGTGPQGNTLQNGLDYFSMLVVEPHFDAGGTAHQSVIKGTTRLDTFSRALLIDASSVDGSLFCGSAGDAWKDAGVTVTGALSGCEHAQAP